MTLQPRAPTYLGIFLVALATLMYEILLTRIFSVTMLYHFAFVALSVAMFGLTAGALIVYLVPGWFAPDRVSQRLALAATVFPNALVLSFLIELRIPFRVSWSWLGLGTIALTSVVIAVPFVVSGVAICLALTSFPSRVSRLYAAISRERRSGACSSLPFSIGLMGRLPCSGWRCWSLGAIAFAIDAESPKLRRVAVATTIVLSLAAAGHTVLVRRGTGIIRLVYSKGVVEPPPLYEKWNSYSRVRVTGDPERAVPAQGWGLSPALPPSRLRQLQLDIDAWAGTVMTHFDGDLPTVGHLKYDVTNIAYYLRPDRDTLVIGAGGGRDVLSALVFGGEIRHRRRDQQGHHRDGQRPIWCLHRPPGPGSARAFRQRRSAQLLPRSTKRYGMIQISLIRPGQLPPPAPSSSARTRSIRSKPGRCSRGILPTTAC